MLYFLSILIFIVAIFLMVFAKDSYINKELESYQLTLNEPWIHRIIALKYDE